MELAQALTALKASTAELLQRKKQLQQLNRWFDIALNNMGRGLSMFDSQQRLIVCNRLYRDIYDLPRRLTRPGTPLANIVRFHVKRDQKHDDPNETDRQLAWIRAHVAKLARGETFSYTQQLKNGKTVQVTNQPLPGGGWVDIQEDITERRKAEEKIAWLAHHDPLTSAANRISFSRELENALRHLRPGTGFAVHWIDLDKFKEINDRLGHPVGDALLKSVVHSLCRTVRGHDLVARLGGDEFAVVQAGVTTAAEAEKLAKRLLTAIRAPRHLLGHHITIGASIGVVLAPQHGTRAEELMKNVDLALYEAKAAGRGTFALFGSYPAKNGEALLAT
ncbi:MAG: diguanylate cyclase [Hyphomicrobium sp.]|nr:MAG: diguanylate cyclase [Hyphomicrobium sp.]MBZ0210073.1 diguanylate cyclase [Hyphomicrobium sp.]